MCILVYDVSNRESFEALPRWSEELENYVPPEVVKIVVGNKLDKVLSFPLLSPPSSFPATADVRHSRLHARTHARHPHLGIVSTMPTSEGAAFAARTGCLFVEESAKTAGGVTVQRGRRANHRYAFAVE
jgi:Ras-related protein Rab-18